VIFPGYSLQDLPAHALREFTFGDTDLPGLAGRVTNAMTYWQAEGGRGGIGAHGLEALVKKYAESYTYRVPFAKTRDRGDRAVLELTDRQFEIVESIRRNHRVAAGGCAGSGKTVLAIKTAERLGADGARVLLTCFNADLAEHLRTALVLPSSVQVVHYQDLCRRLASEAQLINPLPRDRNASETWERKSVIAAIDKLGTRYDAVIVDEGQDFAADWLEVLELLLERDADPFYVFYDVYSGPMRLSGRSGPKVVVETFDTALDAEANEWRAVQRIIDRFRRELGVDDEDLIVLSPFGRRSAIRAVLDSAPQYRRITFETIFKFKGRDHPVVILAEVARRPPGDAFDWTPSTLAYVGASRARHALGVTLPTDFGFPVGAPVT
jgi:hypothetical protein